jgi:DNA-binding transcriptional LysR family regulator
MAIKDNHSFSKAAEALGVTQSAISQSLKNLEAKVGVKLVTRSGKNMALTGEGQKMCVLANGFFKDMESTLSEIRDEKNLLIGDLNVGTLFGVGKSWVAPRLIEFAKQNELINMKITMDFPENLLDKFEKNLINCLILPDVLTPEYALSKKLQNEYATLVFPKNHPDFKLSKDIKLKDLLKYPLILFEDNDPLFYRWCKLKYKSVPRKLKTKLVVNSFGHILKSVSEGMGIAVIPTHVYERSFYKKDLSDLGDDFKMKNNHFSFIFHEEAKDLKKIKKLHQFLKESQ